MVDLQNGKLATCGIIGLVGFVTILQACSDDTCRSSSRSFTARPAAGVTAFSDCGELRTFLVETMDTQRRLAAESSGCGGNEDNGSPAVTFTSPSEPTDQEPFSSGTNVQEPGVDEPDFVKYDGEYLYVLSGERLVILDAFPPEEMAELSRLPLPARPIALFVEDPYVLVLSQSWEWLDEWSPSVLSGSYPALLYATLVDTSVKTAPSIVRELDFEGSFLDARLTRGKAHLVFFTDLQLLWSQHSMALRDGEGSNPGDVILGAQLTSGPEDLVADDLLPTYWDRTRSETGSIETVATTCPCESVFFPTIPNGVGLMTLAVIDMREPVGPLRTISIVSNSGTVYSSAESLYVATSNAGLWSWWQPGPLASPVPRTSTVVHKFDLAATPSYAASGEVPGRVLNAFSMSERGGFFRVATTEDHWGTSEPPENRLFVLSQEGGQLSVVGKLEGLGKRGERIYAVRFIEDQGYVVTFQQIDPLYVLDLSDPFAPAKLGSLDVPGFSTYLHPIQDSLLLAVGQNTENSGVDLSLFDVSVPSAPILSARESIGSGTHSEAQYDHKAFSYFPSEQILALPAMTWSADPASQHDQSDPNVFSGLLLYDVEVQTGFSFRGVLDHSEFYNATGGGDWHHREPVRRSFLLSDAERGDYIFTVSPGAIKVSGLRSLAGVAAVDLHAAD